MADTVDKAVYVLSYQTGDSKQQLDSIKRSTDAVVESTEKLAISQEKLGKSTSRAGDELSRVEARYSQQFRLEQQLQRERDRMARLAQEGVGSEQERARVFSIVEARIRQQISALNEQHAAMAKAGTATGLARHEMINLGRQIQDVTVSLAGGQSPFRILIEQGSQIADIFLSSRANLSAFWQQVTAGAARAFTSTGAIIAGFGAIAGALATAATAALSFLSAQRDIERSLLGVGRVSRLTAKDIEDIASSSSRVWGASTSEVRAFATALAQSGRVGGDEIREMSEVAKELAQVLGVDVAQAGQELSKLFRDPGGIQKFNDEFALLDANVVKAIQDMAKAGDVFGAASRTSRELSTRLREMSSEIQRTVGFWSAMGTAISIAWDATGRFLARSTGIGTTLAEDIAMVEAELVKVINRWGAWADLIPGQRAEIEKLRAELQRLQALQAGQEQRAAGARTSITATEGARVIRDISPEIAQIGKLNEQLRGTQLLLEQIGQPGTGAALVQMLRQMGITVEDINKAFERAREAKESFLRPEQRATAEFESQLANIQARTAAERASAAAAQSILQTAGTLATVEERRLAAARAVYLVQAQIAASYRDQMLALQDQIRVNSAITGTEKMRAQEIARTNQLLREGYSQSQASDIAAMERLATQKQINAAVEQQTQGIRDQIQYLRDVSQYGRDAANAAAAYRDAIRQGADHTVAAARAAATLELNMERAQLAAEEAAAAMANASRSSAQAAANAGNLAAKLDLIGTGSRPGGSFQAGSGVIGAIQGAGGFGPSATGVAPLYTPSWATPVGQAIQGVMNQIKQGVVSGGVQDDLSYKISIGDVSAIKESQQKAAQAAEDAARAQEAAAEAARQAAEELRKQGNESFQNFAAAYLIKGIAPLAVNAMIESGAIPRFDPSTTFQTQLDLYKRAGVSAERTRADILAGIIGEGVAPTELLAALDSLTDAVGANTAAQLGLSDFYTQQGDRLLGYRGYNVQTGIPRGTGSGTVIGGTGTGTGAEPYGGVPNTYPAGTPVYDPNTGIITTPGIGTTTGTGGGVLMQRILNGYIVEGYYSANGQWTTTRTISIAPGISKPADTYGTPVGQTPAPVPLGSPVNYTPYMQPTTKPTPTMLNQLYGQPTKYFAEGGVALSPTYGIFGERGPEAFVPLRGGAIPVKLMMPPGMQTAAGAAVERTVINILAPLINFMAEPTRDEVRESAFQAAQQLRRMMAAA